MSLDIQLPASSLFRAMLMEHIYAAAAAEVDCMSRISRNQFGRRFRIPGIL